MPILSGGGKFLSAKTSKAGDVLTFSNAGEYVDGRFLVPPTKQDGTPNPRAGQPKKELRFEVDVNGESMIFTANATNQAILKDAYGRNTDDWVGRKCSIMITKVNIGGQLKDSVMLTPMKAGDQKKPVNPEDIAWEE